MKTFRLTALAAALLLLLSACAGEAATWTFSPAPSVEPTAVPSAPPSASPSAEPSAAPSEEPSAQPSAAPSTPPSVAPSEPAGEARVIELELTGTIQIHQGGQQITQIPVAIGEKILFRVDNTANFDHNLYIGTDAELSVPNATTDVGVPTWQSGVREFEWTVPEDVANLKFGCTVVGHYGLMNGTFVVEG